MNIKHLHAEITTDNPSITIVTSNKETQTRHENIHNLYSENTDSSSEEENQPQPKSKHTKRNKTNLPSEQTLQDGITIISKSLYSYFQHIYPSLLILVTLLLSLSPYPQLILIPATLCYIYQTYRHITGNSRDNETTVFNLQDKKYAKQTVENQYNKLPLQTSLQHKMNSKLKKMKEVRKPKAVRNIEDCNTEEEKVYLYDLPSSTPLSTKLVIPGLVSDVPVVFEVDTGSSVTIIPEEVFTKIKNKAQLKEVKLTRKFFDFQGNQIQTLGMFKIPLQLGEHILTEHQILVTKTTSPGQAVCLIGIDLIRAKRLSLEVQDDASIKLTFKTTGSTIRRSINTILQSNTPIFSNEDVEIEGSTPTIINVSLNSNINRIYIENAADIMGIASMSLDEDILSPPQNSIFKLDNNSTFQVPVFNKSLGRKTIFRGEPVGHFNVLPPNTIVRSPHSDHPEIIGEQGKPISNLNNILQDFELQQAKIECNVVHVSTLPDTTTLLQVPGQKHKSITDLLHSEPTTPQPTFTFTVSDKRIIATEVQPQPYSSTYWSALFTSLHKRHNLPHTTTIDATNLNEAEILAIKRGFKRFSISTPNSKGTLNIYKPQLQVNKIRAFDGPPSDSDSTVSESDLCEELLPPRIPDNKNTWEEVLRTTPSHLQSQIFYLLTEKYKHVVSKGATDFGACTTPNSKFHIKTTDEIPLTTKPYPLNTVYSQQINETIDEMVSAGLLIAEPSNYATGIFVRPRPDQSGTNNHRIRIIYDLRGLNAKTVRDLYPIPNIKALLQKTARKKWFSTLDLKDSYQSILIDENDRHKASIVTATGQYTPTRMGYGYTNAPSHFSRVIADTIRNITNTFNYLDDILIVADTVEEMMNILDKVLSALQTAGFRISLSKLSLFKRKIKLLGFIITTDGIYSDPIKTSAISKIQPPTNKTEMQRFLGTVNYHSDFIKDYAKLTLPLTKYVADDITKFTLTEDELKAFEAIKTAAINPVRLNFIDPDLDIFLEVDASATAYGGVAYQVRKYHKDDIPTLEKLQHEYSQSTEVQLNKQLEEIIHFQILLRHKKGQNLKIADNLSRMWTTVETLHIKKVHGNTNPFLEFLNERTNRDNRLC